MSDSIDALSADLDRLETELDGAASLTRGFEAELARMREGMAGASVDMGKMERGMSSGLRRAFDALAIDGARLGDAMAGLGQTMLNTAYNSAMKPVTDQIGGVLAKGVGAVMNGVMPFAKGGTFTAGRVMPFAKGGVVSQPTTFPMRGGTGLMGEAGPEAIMPLARGADGRLGVQAGSAARKVSVVMNISTPDAQSFQRSKSQIANAVGRALSQAQRSR